MNRWLFLLAISGGIIGCADPDMLDEESDDSLAQTVSLDGSVVTPSSIDAGISTSADGGSSDSDTDGGASGASSAIGQACMTDSDCAAPATKCNLQVSIPIGGLNINFTGGYCTKPCTANDECGAGAGCPLSGAASFLPDISTCLKQCTEASDCRDGYSCTSLPAFPGAAPASGTPAGRHCLPPLPFPSGGGRLPTR